jgi:hypothetical protein
VTVFLGKEGEEARRLHCAAGGRHNKERRGGRGGQRRQLLSRGRRLLKEIGSVGRMRG